MRVEGLREEPDAALLTLVRRGDVDALGVVYDRHIDVVWRVACAFAQGSEEAERAVLAAFSTLWLDPEADEPTGLAARLLASVWREASRTPDAPFSPH